MVDLLPILREYNLVPVLSFGSKTVQKIKDKAVFYERAYQQFIQSELAVSGKKLVLLSGPVAVGKGPLVEQLQRRFPGYFEKIVLYTSRKPRIDKNEQDGIHYHFRTAEEIEDLAKQHPMSFVTMAVHKDLQGIDLRDVERAVDSGKIAFAEVSVDWAALLRRTYGQKVYSVFMAPLSDEEIIRRSIESGRTADQVIYAEMMSRQKEFATDQEDRQMTRAMSAVQEMKRRGEYDVAIINRTLYDVPSHQARWDEGEGQVLTDEFMSLVIRATGQGVSNRKTKNLLNAIVNEDTYHWGSGEFRHIADIRKRVYTVYYTLDEHMGMMRGIVGQEYDLREHARKLLGEIENPLFGIDAMNYEQIKSHLWKRSKEEFGDVIHAWEDDKDRKVMAQSGALVKQFERTLEGIDLTAPQGFRKAVLISTILEHFDILKERNAEEVFEAIHKALAQQNTPFGINTPIDFTNLLFEHVNKRRHKLVLLPGDINTLAVDMKLYVEYLMRSWVEEIRRECALPGFESAVKMAQDRGLCITVIANEGFRPRSNNTVLQRNVTRKNIEQVLELEELSLVRQFVQAGLVAIQSFRSDFSGTVLTDLSEENITTIYEADLVIAKGQQNGITLDGLKKNTFRLHTISDFSNIFYTGLKFNKEDFQYPQCCCLFAPAGVLPAIDYTPDLETKLTAHQFYEVFLALPYYKWEEIVTLLPFRGYENIIELLCIQIHHWTLMNKNG